MRREPYRLSFLLPADAMAGPIPVMAAAAAGGCEISVHRAGLVVVLGPSREAVFDCAAEVLRRLCAGGAPVIVGAVLMTPGRGLCGRDSWSVIIGADVAFSPTGLPPIIPGQPARAPPRLVVVDGEDVH